MRRILAASLVVIAACRTATPPPAAFGSGSEELVKVAKELNQAFAARDTARVKSFLTKDYVLHFTDREMTGTLLDSPIAPRGQWIVDAFTDLSNGPLEWAMIDARVIGNVGVVVSHYKWSGMFRNKGFQRDGYLTDVWVRRGRSWQVLLSSTTLIDPR